MEKELFFYNLHKSLAERYGGFYGVNISNVQYVREKILGNKKTYQEMVNDLRLKIKDQRKFISTESNDPTCNKLLDRLKFIVRQKGLIPKLIVKTKFDK